MTDSVMITIRTAGKAPTLQEVKARYGLTSEEIDEGFGVVLIDPADELYTILVDRGAAGKVRPDQDWSVEGPYSNPRIETFGPPEPEDH